MAWSAPFVPPMGGDASHFLVDRVGEGKLFLAAMSQETVGIAISTWTIWAIDRERVSKPIEVQNYPTLSFATAPRQGAACRLLAARWHHGWEPGRGTGSYIAGSWYTVDDGAFEPMRERPTVYKRYLFSVERARFDAEQRDQPFLWFRDATIAVGPRPLTGKDPSH